MLRSYGDILTRLGDPLWYDANGCPRYDPFSPDLCDVYNSHIALTKIGCQCCDGTWIVASEYSLYAHGLMDRLAFPDLTSGSVGSFHYGDPPRHGDSGDTMNSIPLEILEFWSRSSSDGLDGFRWKRQPQYEGKIQDKGDDDDHKVL